MNSTKNLPNLNKKLEKLFDNYPIIRDILKNLFANNGRAYLVGGAVRDLLFGLEITDFDIEVHNLEPEKLFSLLKNFAPVNYVGKSFGVIKMAHLPVDWSLPREDSAGRKPLVMLNPNMSIEKALLRRDLTINAIAIDLESFQIIDPFNGYQDLKNKILRSPNINFFIEDPLRFYRVMQFIGRFDMYPDEKLEEACKKINISSVSLERKEQEFDKLLLKSNRPSAGFRWLLAINRLKEILPELSDTINIKQDPIWHPEGSVFEHLMQTLDAATIITKNFNNIEKKLVLRYAALCHDLGKVNTTRELNGRIHSYGHEITGVILANNMLKKLTNRKGLINSVKNLIRYHMVVGQLVIQKSSLAAYKRLALKLCCNNNLLMLAELAEADMRGRNGESSIPLNGPVEIVEKFIKLASKANVLIEPEGPILTGKDLIDIIKPGPQMGALLKFIYKIQVESGIKNKEVLKKMAQDHILSNKNKIS